SRSVSSHGKCTGEVPLLAVYTAARSRELRLTASNASISSNTGDTMRLLKWLIVPVLVLPTHDGQHDFDFGDGTWHSQIRRLQHPLTGSTTWLDYDGKVHTRKLWGGKAHLEEVEVDGPDGHIEGMTLRLYDPKAHEWSLNWATSDDGTIGPPAMGAFKSGLGEF